jgi:hypothetical protein
MSGDFHPGGCTESKVEAVERRRIGNTILSYTMFPLLAFGRLRFCCSRRLYTTLILTFHFVLFRFVFLSGQYENNALHSDDVI